MRIRTPAPTQAQKRRAIERAKKSRSGQKPWQKKRDTKRKLDVVCQCRYTACKKLKSRVLVERFEDAWAEMKSQLDLVTL